jgi:hypothetical protein
MSDENDPGSTEQDPTPDDEVKWSPQGFMGFSISKLAVITAMQLRATSELSIALKTDPSVSEFTREQADKSLERITLAVDELEKVMGALVEYYNFRPSQ